MSDREDQVVPETTDELIMDHLAISEAGRRAVCLLCTLSTPQLVQIGKQIAKKEKHLKKRRLRQRLLWNALPPQPPKKVKDGKRKHYCRAERLRREDYNKKCRE